VWMQPPPIGGAASSLCGAPWPRIASARRSRGRDAMNWSRRWSIRRRGGPGGAGWGRRGGGATSDPGSVMVATTAPHGRNHRSTWSQPPLHGAVGAGGHPVDGLFHRRARARQERTQAPLTPAGPRSPDPGRCSSRYRQVPSGTLMSSPSEPLALVPPDPRGTTSRSPLSCPTPHDHHAPHRRRNRVEYGARGGKREEGAARGASCESMRAMASAVTSAKPKLPSPTKWGRGWGRGPSLA
jgi:hypothetical protein